MAFNFSTVNPKIPTANAQWGAINNAAKINTLVSQLFAGKTPQATASAAAVKSLSAPQSNPTFSLTAPKQSPSFGTTQTTTPTTPVAGTPTNLLANMGIGGANTVGSSPTFQPVTSGLMQTGQAPTPKAPAETSAPQMATVEPAQPQNDAAQKGNTPITGVTTLPNGTTVNADTGAVVKATPTATTSTFSGLLGRINDTAKESQDIGKNAADIMSEYGNEIKRIGQAGAAGEAGTLTTGTTPVATGNAAVIAQNTAALENAAAQGAQTALQGTGQQLTAQQQAQSGLLGAAGLAKGQPTAYGQTVFDPTTNTFTDSNGNSYSPEALASQLAPLVANGQMSIDAANAQMTGSTAGLNALRQAVLGINPNFNFNLSSSSATTQAQGQQLQTQSNTVNAALDTLTGFYGQLAPYQTQGIPLTNSLAQSLGQFLGSGTVSQYNTALNDARVQVQNILGSLGVTPTESGTIVNEYLPAGMTPQQLQSNIGALKTLIQQKVSNFTASGQQQTAPSSTGGGSIWSF